MNLYVAVEKIYLCAVPDVNNISRTSIDRGELLLGFFDVIEKRIWDQYFSFVLVSDLMIVAIHQCDLSYKINGLNHWCIQSVAL